MEMRPHIAKSSSAGGNTADEDSTYRRDAFFRNGTWIKMYGYSKGKRKREKQRGNNGSKGKWGRRGGEERDLFDRYVVRILNDAILIPETQTWPRTSRIPGLTVYILYRYFLHTRLRINWLAKKYNNVQRIETRRKRIRAKECIHRSLFSLISSKDGARIFRETRESSIVFSIRRRLNCQRDDACQFN